MSYFGSKRGGSYPNARIPPEDQRLDVQVLPERVRRPGVHGWLAEVGGSPEAKDSKPTWVVEAG